MMKIGRWLLAQWLLAATSCLVTLAQRGCNVAVYQVAVDNNDTLQYLKSISSQLLPANSTGPRVEFNFTYLPIKTNFSEPAQMPALELELQSRNIYAVVANYYLSVAVVTYTYGIPYFISGDVEYSMIEYKSHMFQYQIDHDQLNGTLFDLNAALKKQGYTIFTDGTATSNHFTANVAGRLFSQRVINASTTDSEIFTALVSNKDLLQSHSWVLVYMPENLNQIERIFNQSGPAGVLTDTGTFIIPSVVEKQQYLANVRQSYAVIYTFMLPGMQRYDKAQLERLYLKDCFKHFAAAIQSCRLVNKNNYTLVDALMKVRINGESGVYGYRNGIRNGLTINVMATDRSQPESNFLLRAGTWVQDAVPAYNPSYLKTSSIRNSLIRFAAVIDKPYMYRNLHGELTGLSYELIQLMQKALHFQYELVFVPGDIYGTKQPDGSWTGIMKYLVDNKADMSATFLSATSDRIADVDLSVDLLQTGIKMLIKRSIHPLDFFNVFYPFSWYVWISIVFSMVILSVTLFVSDKISPNKSDKPMFSFAASFFLVLSSFLMSKVETEPKKPSARLFTLLLWFSTLFYMTTYVSNLVPFLVKPDESVPFDSIAGLQNATNYNVLHLNNSLAYALVKKRWPDLTDPAKRDDGSQMIQPTLADAVELVRTKERYVLIGTASNINYESTKDCTLKTHGAVEEVMYESMMFSKKFVYKEEIRNFLTSIRFTDYQSLEKKYFSVTRCPTSVINPADKTPLNFNYFAGLFASVGVGAILGFLYIILHWIYRRVSIWLARRRGKTKLKYGEAYDAEILKIHKEGVWVKIDGRQEVFFIANNSLHSDPTKVKNAKSLNLRVRQRIRVQYFGRDSATNNRIFARLFENSEWLVAERNRVVDEDSD